MSARQANKSTATTTQIPTCPIGERMSQEALAAAVGTSFRLATRTSHLVGK